MNIVNKINNLIIKILSVRRKKKAERKLKKELNDYFDKIINKRIKTMSEIDGRRFQEEFIKFMQKFNK